MLKGRSLYLSHVPLLRVLCRLKDNSGDSGWSKELTNHRLYHRAVGGGLSDKQLVIEMNKHKKMKKGRLLSFPETIL